MKKIIPYRPMRLW